MSPAFWMPADWSLPAGVRAGVTLRTGGVSLAPFDSLNLGDHVGDQIECVRQNRNLLQSILPAEPRWLQQVHGIAVLDADQTSLDIDPPKADAAITSKMGCVLAILSADCLPILFCLGNGAVVGVAHAGWRGLCAGVLEATALAMMDRCQQLNLPHSMGDMSVWLGPGIGARHYEVGEEVKVSFEKKAQEMAYGLLPEAFTPVLNSPKKYQADLLAITRQRLNLLGIYNISGGNRCTYSSPHQFFSHRRHTHTGVDQGLAQQTGRFASFIWKNS